MLLRRVARIWLVPLAVAIGALSIGPTPAQALVERWHGNQFLQPGQTYFSPTNYNPFDVIGNIAAYQGAGSVSVCQITNDGTAGVFRTGCAINAVGNALNLQPYYPSWLIPGIKNNSPWAHTITGWFYLNI